MHISFVLLSALQQLQALYTCLAQMATHNKQTLMLNQRRTMKGIVKAQSPTLQHILEHAHPGQHHA
jgi:hypothetical protein